MPIYNGHAFLAEALSSIHRQKGCPLEILIVDDGSTDDTPQVIAALGDTVRCVRQEHGGISAARNTGVRNARGDWIAFLDSDDVWSDGKLKLQLQYLAAEPWLEMISGRGELLGASGEEWDRSTEFVFMAFALGAAMIRRDVFDRIGYFDAQFELGEDIDVFMRALEANIALRLHGEVVLHYRRHAQNTTNDLEAFRRGMLYVYKRSIDRRRTANGELKPLPRVDIPDRVD
jgi:glycosyltransferase involved in cell wall biosynthesis